MNHSKKSFLQSSIGKKQLMGITGLGLAIFVLTHMAGNLLMFVSPEAYNKYGHALTSNPLIYAAELGLLAMVLAHIVSAIVLKIRNKSARDQAYAKKLNGEKSISYSSQMMIHSGMIILIFIVLHLITFKFGTLYNTSYDGVEMRDIHRLVMEVFQSPYYVVWYLISLVLLFSHLSHGVQSTFKTLGFNHPKYNSCIEKISLAYAWIVSIGFISQPLYVFFFN